MPIGRWLGLLLLLSACSQPAPPLLLVTPGAAVDVDVSRRFPGNEALSYRIRLSRESHGLAAYGTHVRGMFAGVGAVRVSVVAIDSRGASREQQFNIAAPAPVPGSPRLPATPANYDDLQLGLPDAYRRSRADGAPFWDTTPPSNPTTNAGATLGRVLFYDRRLSSTNTHSCASCHQQAHGFADPRRFSIGATGEPTRRNAMGLANVRYSLRDRYFADARVRTLEALALAPIQDPAELANSLPHLVATLRDTPFYPPLFAAAFGTPEISADRIARALAQFLRSLVSHRAALDTAYPGGASFPQPSPAFTAVQNAGLKLLIEGNCLHCHVDTVLTMVDPSGNGLDAVPVDKGQGDGKFRAASLRNIARTAPYMHDGRFATLREVIDHYDHGVQASEALSPLLREPNSDAPRRLGLKEAQKHALEAVLATFTDEAMLEDPRFSDPFPPD